MPLNAFLNQQGSILCITLLCLSSLPACSGGDDSADLDASGGSAASGGKGGSSGGAGGSAAGSGGSSTSGGAGTGGSAGSSAGGSTNAGSGGAPNGGSAGAGGGSGGTNYVPFTCPEGSSSVLPDTKPSLTPGTWVNISPPGVPFDASASAVTQGMTMDPCNPGTLYVCVRFGSSGIYKTTDGGGTWNKAGPLDGCIGVRTDPADPMRVYSGDGVGSASDGFWVSTDAGDTWTMPDGYKDAVATKGTYDVYKVSPDPTDFDHVLVSFHSGWNGGDSGVYESFNAGESWTAHDPPASWPCGCDVFFLYNPELGIGDSHTWLFGTQGNGYWRTTNSGDSWTKVSDTSMEHGGGQIYYAPDGTLYVSGSGHILKSTNNGESWTEIGPYNGYLSVTGDGNKLYTGGHGGGKFVTASLADDTTWTDFNEQTFFEGPFEMAYDPANGILYAANIRAGVFALKVE